MSNCKMSLMVLCVGSVTLAYSASARAQPFEGCGVLALSPNGSCRVFVPDSGEFPLGLGRLTGKGFGSFQIGDRIHASGLVVTCGGFCTFEFLCFDGDSVIAPCTTPPPSFIPAASTWGLTALALLLLVAGMIVMRRRNTSRYRVSVFAAFLVLAQSAPTLAQGLTTAEKVNKMLQGPHDAEHLLVRFKAATPPAARGASHAACGAIKIKAYRYVDGLTLVKVPGGDLSAALTSYLSDANVLYAEPNYIGQVGVVPSDTHFGVLWIIHAQHEHT